MRRRSGSAVDRGLVHRAAEELRSGPVHTLELARSVLRIEGHPGAASAAVFALLGADDRFLVDAEGRWRLAPSARALGRRLEELSFAVVDVETTGGDHASGHRMTEIALVEVRNGAVVDEWQTLVNPGRGIPRVVQRITGISNDAVRSAPFFEHVAHEVARRLEGRVFVAHNVRFDWGFVSGELAGAGTPVPSMPHLCTVRMARALVPGLRRRNLDALSRHFGIPIHERHRAYGDALATARVLIRMLDEATGRGIGDLRALKAHLRMSRKERRRARARQGDLLARLDAGEGRSGGVEPAAGEGAAASAVEDTGDDDGGDG